MRRTVAIAMATWSIFNVSNSHADEGAGLHRRETNVLEAIKAPDLNQIGEDVVRFSSTPELGGRGVVIEIHRQDAQWSTGTMTLLTGHPSDHWVVTATIAIEMKTSRFEALAREIDAELLRKELPTEIAQDEILVCTDGPGYITERLSGGHSQRVAGFCGDNPNNRIAELIAPIASESIERWLPNFILDGAKPR